MEDDHFLECFLDCGQLLSGEGERSFFWRRIFLHPLNKGIQLWFYFFSFLRCAAVAENSVFSGGEPSGASETPAALFASAQIREHTVDLEQPGFKIPGEQVQVSSFLESAQDGEQEPVECIILGP